MAGVRVKILLFSITLMISLGLCAHVRAQADVNVTASLNRDTIGLDEQAVLQVEVSGTEQNLPNPQMPTLSMFEVYSQGRTSSISIVNGKVSSTVTYRYLMLPTKAGIFPIDNIAIVYKNKRYKADRLEITVLNKGVAAPQELEESATDTTGQSKDYFLDAVIDKKNPYVNEQVTLTLKLYLGVKYYGSPELTEPTTTGFWTEILGNKTPYYQKLNGRNYKVVERKYALFPTQTGDLTIGRAAVKLTVATRSRSNMRRSLFDDFFGQGEEVTIRSLPIKINVRSLPPKGRPDDFTGTIGNFDIKASPDKTQVEVNEPVTLTIEISGVGNIKSVAEPIIPDLPDFRVYKASSNENYNKINDHIGGTKVYEEVFIPNRSGDLKIPSLSFNFFNPKTGKYEIKKTKAVNLRVEAVEGLAKSAEIPYSQTGVVLGSKASDIRYIKLNLGHTLPRGYLLIKTPLYMAINGLPVLLFIGLVVWQHQRRRLSADIGYARSRAAARMARKRLSRARSLAKVEHTEKFYAELSLALYAYIADKLNISPNGLTSDKVADLLKSKNAEDALVEETVKFIQECDFARFAPSTINQDSIDQALEKAEKLMVRIEGVRFA